MTSTQSRTRRSTRRIGAAAAAVGIAVALPQLGASPAGAVPVPWGVQEHCSATGTSPNAHDVFNGPWKDLGLATSATIFVQVCYWGNQGNLQISRVIIASKDTDPTDGRDWVRVTGSGGGATEVYLPDTRNAANYDYQELYPSELYPSTVSSTEVRIWSHSNFSGYAFRGEIPVKLT